MEEMEELVRAEFIEQHEQRCSDCGIVLEQARDYAAVCEVCGEPLCRDCADGHARREEPMMCVACWESDSLTSEE